MMGRELSFVYVFQDPVTDEIFNTTDNLVVIWVDSLKELEDRRGDIQMFIDYVRSLNLDVDLRFLYSVR